MTHEKTFAMLFPANIMSVWNEVEQLLRPTIDRAGTHTSEDVRKAVLNGSLHLWVQWNPVTSKIEAAAVTEMVPYPRELRLRVWLAGALQDGDADWQTLSGLIANFGKDNKCAALEVMGRKGWKGLFPEAKENATLFRMQL